MHQQVSIVPDAGRVVARGELEAADVVDAGLHQPVHVLLGGDEAWLRRKDQNEEFGKIFFKNVGKVEFCSRALVKLKWVKNPQRLRVGFRATVKTQSDSMY